jgi:hypothetical protein
VPSLLRPLAKSRIKIYAFVTDTLTLKDDLLSHGHPQAPNGWLALKSSAVLLLICRQIYLEAKPYIDSFRILVTASCMPLALSRLDVVKDHGMRDIVCIESDL